ncbi:hypothetical protein GGR92_000301 [Spirosoma lacussanchae]|uniref:hypothetical protein n=1 Tax=Spirosoma lacussanchae TaxID=1884249 RepID=UPI0011092191|nr:hypothetical protein [Spirosoma lacussanchae]
MTGTHASGQRLCRLLVSLVFTLLIFNRWVVYNTPLDGLDGSWAIALHLARAAGLDYGTDFIFTYGPLGWYTTRLPIAVETWEIVLLDLVYVVHVYIIIWFVLGPQFSWLRYGIVAGLVTLHTLAAGTETPFVFYFFVLAYLGHYQRTRQAWTLVGASVIAILTFYMKANVGLVSLGSLVIYALIQRLTGEMPSRHLLISLGSVATLLALSVVLLPVQLGPYLVAQWHLIDSYNDVMYLVQNKRAVLVSLLILGMTIGALSWPLYRLLKTGLLPGLLRREGVLFGLVALQLFVLFKESFVRADAGHIGFFYKYGLLPFTILALFSAHSSVRRWAVLPMILLAIAAPKLVTYNWDSSFPYRWVSQAVSYGQDVWHPVRPSLVTNRTGLPVSWLNRLSQKRVDIMPADVALLYHHKLRYTPRPIMQTYQVTDAYLDSLNATYYGSARAADYVVIAWDAIDGRDPFNDEPATKLALRTHYAVVDQQGDWLLLGKKAIPQTDHKPLVRTQVAQIGHSVPVRPADGCWQRWQIDCRYRPMGALQRLLFQPPSLHVELTYQSGQRDTFRTAIPLLKGGLLVGPHPRNLANMSHFLQRRDQHLPGLVSIRLLADTSLFYPTVHVHQYPLNLSGNGQPDYAD